MRIKGLNVEQEFDGDPSVDEWIKTFNNYFKHDLSSEELKTITDSIIEAYKTACDYNGEIPKLNIDEQGHVKVFSNGALLHMLPVDSFEKLAKKFLSIKKYGLVSLSMLHGGDDWDNEVPLSVSFHKILPKDTISKKCERMKKKDNLSSILDIGIIFDVQSEGIQKLLAYDISNRSNVIRGDSYRNKKGELIGYKLSTYPKQIKTETEKQALGMLINAERPAFDGCDFAYLPIAVPSKYIVGFVLPDKLKDMSK